MAHVVVGDGSGVPIGVEGGEVLGPGQVLEGAGLLLGLALPAGLQRGVATHLARILIPGKGIRGPAQHQQQVGRLPSQVSWPQTHRHNVRDKQ